MNPFSLEFRVPTEYSFSYKVWKYTIICGFPDLEKISELQIKSGNNRKTKRFGVFSVLKIKQKIEVVLIPIAGQLNQWLWLP